VAVVGYQCTVCKRTINLVQNKAGLDHIGNCNITLGCRGQLVQQEVYLDYIRGSLPPDVVGLKNWVQRQVLFNFTQTVERQTWVITHNLGTLPSVQVYVNISTSGGGTTLEEILPTEIIYNSDDQLTLILPAAYSGIAQLIARASNPDILNPRPQPAPVTTSPTIQLTNQGEITIATRVSTIDIPLGLVNPVTGLPYPMAGLTLTLTYTPSAGTPLSVTYVASNITSELSPWSDTARVLFQGKVYTVRTFNVQTGAGAIANGSAVALTNIALPNSPIIAVIGMNIPANTFTVATDYAEDFTPGTNFVTNPDGTIWVVGSSLYDPITNLTTISPAEVIPLTFSLPATILLPGVRQIVPDEVIILLGDSPFTIYDKVVNSYVDMTAVDSVATQFDMYYNAGDLFANTSIEENIYPPLRSV